jgi:hypothetical protein
MCELSHKPPDYDSPETTSLFPSRPTLEQRSHSIHRKACTCELADLAVWLHSLRRSVRAIAAPPRRSVLLLKGPSLARQELAEERDVNVLMAYGRCLRPALYSSLRSSPSHPTGVSALRVTIAIANARFARKQRGLRK